jgi:hypothetical protein
MPALVAGIHVFLSIDNRKQDVDGRDKPGHDAADSHGQLFEAVGDKTS